MLQKTFVIYRATPGPRKFRPKKCLHFVFYFYSLPIFVQVTRHVTLTHIPPTTIHFMNRNMCCTTRYNINIWTYWGQRQPRIATFWTHQGSKHLASIANLACLVLSCMKRQATLGQCVCDLRSRTAAFYEVRGTAKNSYGLAYWNRN